MKCKISNCQNKMLARGWCPKHYARWRAHGDPLFTKTAEHGVPLKWIEDHIGFSGDECLIWPFARHTNGRAKIFDGTPDRIMCEKVNGPPPSLEHQTAHSCGKGHEACLNPKHLRWATALENAADARVHGTVVRGSRSHAAKLTENDIPEIRHLYPIKTLAVIGDIYGVSANTIHQIVKRRKWRHVV